MATVSANKTNTAKKLASSRFSFRDMSLAKKFGVISAILIMGFTALGGAYYQVTVVNGNATDDTLHITQFGEMVDQINIQFLDMRRLEKDFIISQDASLLPGHESLLRSVESGIAEILEAPPTEEVGTLVEDMSSYLGLYEGSFDEMVASMELAGLDASSGYLGKLNSSAANINELVGSEGELQLQNSLFKMRQQEKAFIDNPSTEVSDSIVAEKDTFNGLLETSAMDADTKLFITSDMDSYIESLLAYGESLRQLLEERETFSSVALEFSPILNSMKQTKESLLDATRQKAEANQTQISMVFVGIILLVAVVVNIVFFKVSRIISRPLQQAVNLSAAIAKGDLNNKVVINSNDETGELLHGLNNMQSQLLEQKVQLQKQMQEVQHQAENSKRMADEQAILVQEQAQMVVEQARIATETGRIKQALDGVSSAVLVLDADLTIIYRNNAAATMFNQGEREIRAALPDFESSALIGKSFAYLSTNGAQEAQMLKSLSMPQTSDRKLGERSYRVTVSPVVDAEGKRIGIVAEWMDRTVEVAVEDEVQGIVSASMRGDLSQRINTKNKQGFFLDLSVGVNQLVDVSEKVILDTVSVLGCVAKGDLTRTMQGNFEGLFAQLKTDVNGTVKKLTEVVTNIQSSASSIDEVTREIADSNAEVSRRTEQQAASLEETAATIEEMTATVKQTAGNTFEANNLAGEARTRAEAGGEIVNQAIGAMTDINNSSKQISNIIGVIDDISFQTNLLALNAAVEAARAGEQGRGFAVVANEVRNLAAHSAEAAKEIKQLINSSNRQVERGTDLVNKSGEALNSIVSSIKRVSTIISEIATASQEQSNGIELVNSSIGHIDEGTQQNAAMVEKVTTSIDVMSDEAEKLNDMMKFFSTANVKESFNKGSQRLRSA
ncbi:MAG: methyl-accepting chemotaxis protein [Pseudomonadota bacterium]